MSDDAVEECEISISYDETIVGVYRFGLQKIDLGQTADVTRHYFHLHQAQITETTGTTELPLLDRLPSSLSPYSYNWYLEYLVDSILVHECDDDIGPTASCYRVDASTTTPGAHSLVYVIDNSDPITQTTEFGIVDTDSYAYVDLFTFEVEDNTTP